MKKAFQHIDKNNNATYKLTFGVCNVLILALNENTELNLSTAIFRNLTNQDSFLLIAYRKFATASDPTYKVHHACHSLERMIILAPWLIQSLESRMSLNKSQADKSGIGKADKAKYNVEKSESSKDEATKQSSRTMEKPDFEMKRLRYDGCLIANP